MNSDIRTNKEKNDDGRPNRCLGNLLYNFLLALAVHAFFVVGKFAFVQLRKETLEEVVRDGEEQLKKVLPCYDNTGIFLSMAQVGVSLSAFTAGIVLLYFLTWTYMSAEVIVPFPGSYVICLFIALVYTVLFGFR